MPPHKYMHPFVYENDVNLLLDGYLVAPLGVVHLVFEYNYFFILNLWEMKKICKKEKEREKEEKKERRRKNCN